jgi:Fe-Mn family superoxide dismutase
MTNSTDYHLPSLDAADALSRAASGAVFLDLRKPSARVASGLALSGAQVRDPFAFGHDDPLMAETRFVIAFCVHGHEVSQFGCALLLLHGRQAAYVRGGFEALRAAGAPVEELVP